jgi:hypothetical protein
MKECLPPRRTARHRTSSVSTSSANGIRTSIAARAARGFLGPRYLWFSLVVALVLSLLLALAAYAEGANGRRPGVALWMLGLNPTIIVYILLIHPLMQRRWQRAIPVSRLGIVKPHPCAGLDLQLVPVDELTPSRLAALRNQLFAVDGLSVKRVSNILIPLRGMMPMLVVDKYLGADPFALLKPLTDTRVQSDKPVTVGTIAAGPVTVEEIAQFKTGKGKADPLSPTEVRAILEVAYGQVLNMVTFWVDGGSAQGKC